MTRADKFLSLFNLIEKTLHKISPREPGEGFKEMINRLSKSNKIICQYKYDLRDYADLRNAIVHQFTGEAIAEPHEDVIANLQTIHDILVRPPTAIEISSKPVYCCEAKDKIVDVVKTMTAKVYTHVPVYEDDRFVGVFSESSIARWLGENAEKDGFLLNETRVGELKQFFEKDNDPFNSYKFVSKDIDVFTIMDYFLSFVNENKRLGAIFVTNSGRSSEGILGIITSWDLPRIDK
ncbi:MAG TPA: CBS domain-containing protein [candidate division Zixibacteria bacterium]